MVKIENSIFINAPVKKVYQYGTNLKNMSHWIVNLTDVDMIKGKNEAGTIVEFNYSILGMHFPTVLEVLKFQETNKGCVWESNFTGALEGNQTWSYKTKDGGTEVTMQLNSTIPGLLLGVVAEKILVEKLIRQAFQHSLENMKLFCEA